MCSGCMAWLFSSCQGWIIAQERTASPLVCQVSISKWCLDMKNMPAMPSRHSGWKEIKPRAVFECTVYNKASGLTTTRYYLGFILSNSLSKVGLCYALCLHNVMWEIWKGNENENQNQNKVSKFNRLERKQKYFGVKSKRIRFFNCLVGQGKTFKN